MKRWLVRLLGFSFALLLPSFAAAASFTVAPVRITFAARRPYSLLRITNNAEQPLMLQARVYRWSANGQQDVLTATDDVILSPPIMTIAPKASQTVRVGLRVPNENREEATYRILLDEVPSTSPEQGGSALRTLLRISLPVFAEPRQQARASLHWSAVTDGEGKVRLRAVNSGTAHIQLSRLLLSTGENRGNATKLDGSVYLLPNQHHEWTVDNPALASGSQFTLEAMTDSGNVRETVSRVDN